MGSMLHHRFPNGFTDLFMDETDREVSTLTDRAFRSLCVGDDAVYNDEFLYGYSPFSCHKPLAGEPLKKTNRKESKKQGQNKSDKNYAQPRKQQHQKSMSHMSSFLKALSATGESCEGMLIKNGGITDSKGESWDKSALRSIQRELSEFSSGYHGNLKDVEPPSRKSSKTKNGKSAVKIRKLNIKNFFLHSEFSPFQAWTDFNRFPFGQKDTVLPIDDIPKWYDMPFYKELTEAHMKETLHTEEPQSRHKVAAEPPPPTAPKPAPPSPPPVLPKPSATPAEKRCSSDGGDGTSAPWRRNRSRAKSVIPLNQPGVDTQENALKTVDESLTSIKKEVRSVEVKAIDEVSSSASTPFSICQLMTPLIPSRQPTETSEILQGVLSPSALDLSLRPHSEAKQTPEPAVKRDSYKSLASSILFNLKDNRKRVKSRYSPPKFKTSEVSGSGTQSPQPDHLKLQQAGSDGSASGLSTPAISKDAEAVCSPLLESKNTPTVGLIKDETDRPLSDDYLLSNLLHSKRDPVGEQNQISPFINPKKIKSPMVKKQNYPSLNLYKKATPLDSDTKYLQVPLSTAAPVNQDLSTEKKELSPLMVNNEKTLKTPATHTGLSPRTSSLIKKDFSPIISPDPGGSSSDPSGGKIPLIVPDKPKQPEKETKEKLFGGQLVSPSKKENDGQLMSTVDVIRAAKEAINAAKNKALSATLSEKSSKSASDMEELDGGREMKVACSKEMLSSRRESLIPETDNDSSRIRNGATLAGKNNNDKKEPPPVPKRTFVKPDILLPLDKLTDSDISEAKLDLPQNENNAFSKPGKVKHAFSARQNNYIKSQRYSVADDVCGEEFEKVDLKVNTKTKWDEERTSLEEMKDSEHIIQDLHALKELERARLGDYVLDNGKSKLGTNNIDEEARAKNDLISKELRNIKKGMLSMRGNTQAKRELFSHKEEATRQDHFSKIDSNVRVNKAVFNDNYDKAKMALEEIISEREKRRKQSTEPDVKPAVDGSVRDEAHGARTEQRKNSLKNLMTNNQERQNGSSLLLKDKDLKERLGDLRDHNHMRQILSQAEPGLVGRMVPPDTGVVGSELNTNLKLKAKHAHDKLTDQTSYESKETNLRHASGEIGENFTKQNECKELETPRVPPRGRKAANKKDVGVSKERDSSKPVDEDDIFSKERTRQERHADLERQEIDNGMPIKESVHSQIGDSCNKEKWDMEGKTSPEIIPERDSVTCASIIPPKSSQSDDGLSEKFRRTENKASDLQATVSPSMEPKFENWNAVKQIAPSKPDQFKTLDGTKHLVPEESDKRAEEMNVDAEAVSEISRSVLSPLLLVNGVRINQSPPDQASLSSKSSYFSVESALQRNTESESIVYHSLENLIGEVEEVDQASCNLSRSTKRDVDKAEVEYYSLSDHESESEVLKGLVKTPQKEKEVPYEGNKECQSITTDQGLSHDDLNQTPMSPCNTFSPPLGIPALFKVKDNTFSGKTKKTIQPWSPRGSMSGSEKGEEELHQGKENSEPSHKPATSFSESIPDECPKKIPHSPPPQPQSSLNLQRENLKKPQFGEFLTVPQEDDRLSGQSPSSEGMESLAVSTDADEQGLNVSAAEEQEALKVQSEWSGSTYSGAESQPGLPKPPAVLPKSEKAVLKAIKLTNRRIKKEAQKSDHKSSHSKQRADRHKNDKSKANGNSDSKNEKEIKREKKENSHHHGERRSKHDNQSEHFEKGGNNPGESIIPNRDLLPGEETDRQGRSTHRRSRGKPEQRHYSSDRVISNVPVYKAHISERPVPNKTLHRSQSIDRYLEGRVERRLSTDTSVSERLDPRTQRIEKSIMNELQQRGRTRDKASKENLVRRSHSIDAYSTELPHPSSLSRQSSQTSQLSGQSSIEHTIVAQSFPMTQRKLLQDPDSGQYFFVNMPVQVKTKTFFDPETGSYVQLPVQPPEGAVPQAPPLEVLTPPLVVYHSFVPVPLSPMAQNATIQATHIAPEELEQRHFERSRQMHCQETHPYLETAYAQHDHMLGEFLGTEELNCPS